MFRVKDFSVTNNSELRCPIDRGVVDMNKVHEDIALRRVVGSLLVRCSEHELGCQWTGNLSDINIHHEQCQYKAVNSDTASILIDQVKELKDRLDRFELSLFEKEKENALLKHEQLQLKEEMQITRQEQQQGMNAVIQKNAVLEQKMLELEKDKETLGKVLHKLSKEGKEQQKKNEILEQKMHQLEKDKETQGELLNELSKKCEQQQKKNVDLEQRILQLEKDMETQGKLHGELSKERESQQKKNEVLEQKMLQLEKDKETQGNQLDKLSKEREQQQETNANLERKVLQQLMEQAESQEQQQSTINQVLSKVETLQKELASCRGGENFDDVGVAAADDNVAKKEIPFQHHIGDPASIIISKDQQHIEFLDKWVTVSAPTGVAPPEAKVWYEVECTRSNSSGNIFIGWATTDLPTSAEFLYDWVGKRSHSYGFQAFDGHKWHNGPTTWGTWCAGDKYVFGVALDLVGGEVLFSVDGKWAAPMGVAFTGISRDIKLFPAVSGAGDSTIHLNVGDRAFKYSPPDSSYKSLIDAIAH